MLIKVFIDVILKFFSLGIKEMRGYDGEFFLRYLELDI